MTQKGRGFTSWLLQAQPPVGGHLRFVFYGGSLVLFLCLTTPWTWPHQFSSSDFYRPDGVMGAIAFPYLSAGYLWGLIGVTLFAWLCSAVGLKLRPAKWITATGFLFLLGYQLSFRVASDHRHYVLLYAFFLLCLVTSDSEFSIDRWLASRRGKAEGAAQVLASPRRTAARTERSSALGASGFPRQALLIVAVILYFSSAVSKLADGGLAWMDGYSLQFYMSDQTTATSFEFVTAIRVFVASQLWLCAILSAGALLLELTSPMALISRPLRHLYVVGWASMHLGILVLMRPNYWIHTFLIVVLFTDWLWLREQIPGGSQFADRLRRMSSWIGRSEDDAPFVTRSRTPAWIAGALIAVMAAITALQVVWYPLTHVPMYSSYVGRGVVAGVPIEAYSEEPRVLELARSCAGDRSIGFTRRCSWRIPGHLAQGLELRLLGRGESVVFEGSLAAIRDPAIEHLASIDPLRSGIVPAEEGTPLWTMTRALLGAQSEVSLDRYDRFELTYRLSDRNALLAVGMLE